MGRPRRLDVPIEVGALHGSIQPRIVRRAGRPFPAQPACTPAAHRHL